LRIRSRQQKDRNNSHEGSEAKPRHFDDCRQGLSPEVKR
jgi:hypothetical protein